MEHYVSIYSINWIPIYICAIICFRWIFFGKGRKGQKEIVRFKLIKLKPPGVLGNIFCVYMFYNMGLYDIYVIHYCI